MFDEDVHLLSLLSFCLFLPNSSSPLLHTIKLSLSFSLSLSVCVCEAKVLSGHFVGEISPRECLHPCACTSTHIRVPMLVCAEQEAACVHVCVSEVSNIPVQANASAEICLSMQLLTRHYYS